MQLGPPEVSRQVLFLKITPTVLNHTRVSRERRIYNPVKNLRWSFFVKIAAKNC